MSFTCCCYSDTVKIQSLTCVGVHVCCSRVTRRLLLCSSSSFYKMCQSNFGQWIRELVWYFTPFHETSFVSRFQCFVTVARSPLRQTAQRSSQCVHSCKNSWRLLVVHSNLVELMARKQEWQLSMHCNVIYIDIWIITMASNREFPHACTWLQTWRSRTSHESWILAETEIQDVKDKQEYYKCPSAILRRKSRWLSV